MQQYIRLMYSYTISLYSNRAAVGYSYRSIYSYITLQIFCGLMNVKNIFWQLERCWNLHFKIDSKRKAKLCCMNAFFDRLCVAGIDKCVSLARIKHILWNWAQASMCKNLFHTVSHMHTDTLTKIQMFWMNAEHYEFCAHLI